MAYSPPAGRRSPGRGQKPRIQSERAGSQRFPKLSVLCFGGLGGLQGGNASTTDIACQDVPRRLQRPVTISAPASMASGWIVALVLAVASSGQPSALASNEPETYVVQPGHTLASIATTQGIPVERLAELNFIENPEKIKPCDVLRLKDGRRDPGPPSAAESRAGAQTPTTGFYEVQPGDTLYSIARRLGVEPSAILTANSRDNPNLIRPGERIAIPGMTSSNRHAFPRVCQFRPLTREIATVPLRPYGAQHPS